MKKRSLYPAMAMVAVCLSCSSIAIAQQTTTPSPVVARPSTSQHSPPQLPLDQQPSRAEVVRMMDAMRIRMQLEAMTKAMNTQMKRQIHDTLGKQANMTPEQIAKYESAYSEGVSLYPLSEMMDDMVPVYQRHISKSDIDAIISFYASPAGQHLLTEGPAMMQDSMGVVMPKVQARMQAYMQKVTKEAGGISPKSGTATTP